MSAKRPIRQRLWADETVKGRSVGENIRNLDSALSAMSPMRTVEFQNVIYESGGLVFSDTRLPSGAVVIFVAKADGNWLAVNAVPELGFSGSAVSVKISGLTPGERYAVIRLLVVG